MNAVKTDVDKKWKLDYVMLKIFSYMEAKMQYDKFIIPGLKEEVSKAYETGYWEECREMLKKYFGKNSKEIKQLPISKECQNLPLNVADIGGIEVIRVLLQNGLHVNQVYLGNNFTLLHRAAENGYCDLVSFLLTEGADIEQKDSANWTPIHFACRNGHADIVRLLIDHGADINISDTNGNTPLHLAILHGGHIQVVECLVHNNCNTYNVNNKGKKALDIARKMQQDVIVELLSKKK